MHGTVAVCRTAARKGTRDTRITANPSASQPAWVNRLYLVRIGTGGLEFPSAHAHQSMQRAWLQGASTFAQVMGNI